MGPNVPLAGVKLLAVRVWVQVAEAMPEAVHV
jgi:hypothetical protein